MEILFNADDYTGDSVDFEPVFKMLDGELIAIGETLSVVCAGGYVMQLHGYRGTADIDAFYEATAAINEVIRKVGDKFGINRPDELWLNNSISNMNPHPSVEHCETVYSFANLEVKAVDLVYLIGMKLTSARGQDMRDVSEIFKKKKDFLPLGLLSELSGMKFEIDISILLDAFENAHGMEWLEEYYKENESELQQYF